MQNLRMNKTTYQLEPLKSQRISEFLKSTHTHDLTKIFRSPLNIVFPQQMEENAAGFKEIFKKNHINGEIYYATKANKSLALIKGALQAGIKIDVASQKELQDALSIGFTGDKIEATGPKNEDFLALCLLHNVLINIDDVNELKLITELIEKLQKNEPTNILVRLNDFSSDQTKMIRKDSRFGIKSTQISEVYKLVKEFESSINLKGFSFHLPTTSNKERLIAIENVITLFIEAMEQGFDLDTIDIGGGFSISYLESKSQWDEYLNALKSSVVDQTESMSWNDQGLGFWGDKGTLKGAQSFPDFYREKDQFEELDELLSSYSTKFSSSIGDLISENGWKLMIEPGRSMLDQAGITIAKVINTKQSLKGENLIIADMNRSNLNSQDLEFMSDPVVIKSKDGKKKQSWKGFVAGNLCLPHDFVMKRKVFLKDTPQKDDLLVFCNTAGYSMDFAESNTLKQKIAKKIAIRFINNQFEIFEDENYPFY